MALLTNFVTTIAGLVALALLAFDAGRRPFPPDDPQFVALVFLALGLIAAADARNLPPPSARD